MNVAGYVKGIVAIISAAVIAIQAPISDGVLTSQEIVTIALAVLTAVGVIALPNKPPDEPPKEVT